MKYELVDLGPPQGPVYSTAFLHTPKGDFMVKGNHFMLMNHLAEDSFPPFFGKILIHYHKKPGAQLNLISKGVNLSIKHNGKRSYYYFEGEAGFLFKRTRRFPNKWLDCIEPDVKTNLLISADYLEEKGLIIGAEFIRNQVSKLPPRSKINQFLGKAFRR